MTGQLWDCEVCGALIEGLWYPIMERHADPLIWCWDGKERCWDCWDEYAVAIEPCCGEGL